MLQVLDYNVYGLENAVIASGLPMSVDSSKIEYSEKRAKVLGNAKVGSGHNCYAKGILVTARIRYPQYWTTQFQRYHFADIISSQSKMHRITKMDLSKQVNKYVDVRVIDIVNNYIGLYNMIEENKLDMVYVYNNVAYKTYEEAFGDMRSHWGDKSDVMELLIRGYDKYEVFMKIISNIPSGFEMEMEITTNYLQLQTIYMQRRHHKLKEDWGAFCDWIESLPKFKEFCLGAE